MYLCTLGESVSERRKTKQGRVYRSRVIGAFVFIPATMDLQLTSLKAFP